MPQHPGSDHTLHNFHHGDEGGYVVSEEPDPLGILKNWEIFTVIGLLFTGEICSQGFTNTLRVNYLAYSQLTLSG